MFRTHFAIGPNLEKCILKSCSSVSQEMFCSNHVQRGEVSRQLVLRRKGKERHETNGDVEILEIDEISSDLSELGEVSTRGELLSRVAIAFARQAEKKNRSQSVDATKMKTKREETNF